LSTEEIGIIIKRALEDKERGLGAFDIELDREAFNFLVQMADGDARVALNALEIAFMTVPPDSSGKRKIGLSDIENAIQQRSLIYDKNGEQHYDLISALHKSIRGSDPDGALYWLARMLEAGEDPLYIARRVVRAASEDIGLADPQALVIAMSAQQAVNFIGMPEGNLALAQAVVYLATAPKSNSLYLAYTEVQDEIKKTGSLTVPLHIRNPVTSLMASLGYGQGYKYAHNFPGHFVPQQYLPTSLIGKHFYKPSDQGYEIEVGRRLANWWGRKVPQKE
jgi:putative ATPase